MLPFAINFVRGYYFWKVGINKFLDIAEWRAKERANERANGRAIL